MSKFASNTRTARGRGTLHTNPEPRVFTHEGARAFAKDPKTELFTLAVARFLGEDSFYETADQGVVRFKALVRQIATEDATWLLKFIGWLRNDANIRTGSIVAAAEACGMRAKNARAMVLAACRRDDEPAEMLAYWMSNYGRRIPGVLKRGLADAAQKLYDERTVVKYDSARHNMRPGDVIELVHPKPRGTEQATLFKYMLDVRHGRSDPRGLNELPALAQMQAWREHASENPFPLPSLATWETLSSYTKMDAKAWEAVIPQMGYMALLRNLRNFDDAGISHETQTFIAAKLSNPDEVARSRQLPFRFWSAWKNSGTMNWGGTIEAALQESCRNIPKLRGRTLVMVDQSGSMSGKLSGKSDIKRTEAAGLFGAATISRSDGGVLAVYDYANNAKVIPYSRSVLRTAIDVNTHKLGGGTETWPSTYRMWGEHGPFDRIMVFTDMQDHPARANLNAFVPTHVPVYVWDLAGYKTANIETGSGRYLLGGLSDATFKLVDLLENFKPGVWPWEIAHE